MKKKGKKSITDRKYNLLFVCIGYDISLDKSEKQLQIWLIFLLRKTLRWKCNLLSNNDISMETDGLKIT